MIFAKQKYFPFKFEDTQNLVIFNVKVIFGELSAPIDLLKSSIEKFANGWLFEAATRKLFDQKFR